jgi:hypothetical protein
MLTGEDMKNIIQVFLTVMFLSMATQAVADRNVSVVDDSERMRGVIETHNAIESESLRISLDGNLHGFVEGKVCDFCETIRVTITPNTKAYANNVEVPLKNAKNRIGRYATVIYELKTKNVSAIRW